MFKKYVVSNILTTGLNHYYLNVLVFQLVYLYLELLLINRT